MKKLKSFTLPEILVATVLSGIVVGIAFLSYIFFYKRLSLYQDRSNNLASVSSLDRLLSKDMERSALVLRDENKVSCVLSNRTIHYSFSPEYILRQDSIRIDTFYFGVNEVPFASLDEKPVNNGLVSKLSFSLIYDKDSIRLNYRKNYTADELVNYERATYGSHRYKQF